MRGEQGTEQRKVGDLGKWTEPLTFHLQVREELGLVGKVTCHFARSLSQARLEHRPPDSQASSPDHRACCLYAVSFIRERTLSVTAWLLAYD